LRHMQNEELFKLYDSELALRLHNAKNLSDTRKVLAHFLLEYLNGFPPNPELAKAFLAQYADKKPRTLYRYAQMIKGFMKWYGEPMDDFKVKRHKPYLKQIRYTIYKGMRRYPSSLTFRLVRGSYESHRVNWRHELELLPGVLQAN